VCALNVLCEIINSSKDATMDQLTIAAVNVRKTIQLETEACETKEKKEALLLYIKVMCRGEKSASDAETGKINKILPTQRNE